MRELLVARAQQVADGRRGAVNADRRCRVPALRVGSAPDQRAHARLDLHTDDERDEQPLTARAHLLRLRQRGREDRHRWMPAHHVVRVVEVQRVAGRAVDERGDAGRAVQVRADDGARPGQTAQLVPQDPGQRLAAAG